MVDAHTILIVEDNEAYRKILANALKISGFTVLEAENGEVAMNLVRESPPSLILSDVYMPSMDGFTFLSHLRTGDAFKNIPVVMLTNVEEELENAVKAGAEEAILKSSLTPKQVVEVCRKHLGLSSPPSEAGVVQ